MKMHFIYLLITPDIFDRRNYITIHFLMKFSRKYMTLHAGNLLQNIIDSCRNKTRYRLFPLL